jgi:hypothetical protein
VADERKRKDKLTLVNRLVLLSEGSSWSKEDKSTTNTKAVTPSKAVNPFSSLKMQKREGARKSEQYERKKENTQKRIEKKNKNEPVRTSVFCGMSISLSRRESAARLASRIALLCML